MNDRGSYLGWAVRVTWRNSGDSFLAGRWFLGTGSPSVAYLAGHVITLFETRAAARAAVSARAQSRVYWRAAPVCVRVTVRRVR